LQRVEAGRAPSRLTRLIAQPVKARMHRQTAMPNRGSRRIKLGEVTDSRSPLGIDLHRNRSELTLSRHPSLVTDLDQPLVQHRVGQFDEAGDVLAVYVLTRIYLL